MFKGQSADTVDEQKIILPAMSASQHVLQDYATTSLSLKAHPVHFVREKLQQLNVFQTKQLASAKNGAVIKVAGLVLVRQKPETAKGVCFMTIEDETGFANLVIFSTLFEKNRKEILQSKLIMVQGKLQIEGAVIHVIVSAVYNISRLLKTLTASASENLPLLKLSGADEKTGRQDNRNINEDEKSIFPASRNFR